MSILRDDIEGDVADGGRATVETDAHPKTDAHPETFGGLEAAINGLGVEYRQAFRVRVSLPVRIEAPMRLECETVDLSVLGVRFNQALPCAPGASVSFALTVSDRGVSKPRVLELRAQVVRTHMGETGLRFVALSPDQRRAVREIVHEQQVRLVERRAARHWAFRPDRL